MVQRQLARRQVAPAAPANPTGNPNFNLKNRPEVNKSGPGNKKLDRSVINFDEKITKRDKIGRIRKKF
jgi:hypothetical protein